MSNFYDDLKNYLQTEEGKKSVTLFVESQKFYEEVYKPKWVGKIKEKIDDHGADYVIERLLMKYYSDDYRNKEYRLGREPDEVLFYMLLYYARVHCLVCEEEKYWTIFVDEVYYVGSYVIKLLNGQGSMIKIEKIK